MVHHAANAPHAVDTERLLHGRSNPRETLGKCSGNGKPLICLPLAPSALARVPCPAPPLAPTPVFQEASMFKEEADICHTYAVMPAFLAVKSLILNLKGCLKLPAYMSATHLLCHMLSLVRSLPLRCLCWRVAIGRRALTRCAGLSMSSSPRLSSLTCTRYEK
jgi:hypothetical protein